MSRILTGRWVAVALLATGFALAGCGYSAGDRAGSGAAIGAGAGAVGSALLGGPLLGGALIGGAVGAAAGGLTDADDFNLGRPIWR